MSKQAASHVRKQAIKRIKEQGQTSIFDTDRDLEIRQRIVEVEKDKIRKLSR
jgi:hypothetical protein